MKKDNLDKALYSVLLWDTLKVEGAKCADTSIEAYMSSGAESEVHMVAGFEGASKSQQQMAMNDLLAWDATRDDSFIFRIMNRNDGSLYGPDGLFERDVDRQYFMSGYYERIAQNIIHDYTSEYNDSWKKAGINNNLGEPPE